MSYSEIPGGITAPQGFLAGSAFCGIKEGNTDRPDLVLVHSPQPTIAAATFTTNRVKAAPVRVSISHLRTDDVRAIVANAGNANACTGLTGLENAKRMAAATAAALGLKARQVMVCSTGRIGVQLPIEKIESTIATLPNVLKKDGSMRAAKALMTSDTFPKEFAVEFEIDGRPVRIGGIAKGAGMINPNMATMLCFLTTDAAIGRRQLQTALSVAIDQSFNRITVDGDMSTNDTVIVLANGLAENPPLKYGTPAYKLFQRALDCVTCNLARMIVEDGEGTTKFIEVHVNRAASLNDARRAAEAIANSKLVKCAWFGGDPNWGRLMDALGYSGARMREELVDIFYDGVIAVKGGAASKTPFSKLQQVAAEPRFTIQIDLHMGNAEYTVFTTDLSVAYVKLNMGE
ncbi:MAG TPA: bifunctional glutamate N-acetyltransferase/amino-acid acetyltransferase ArgJ [Chthoniobacteraceae bacterium]|nr:bifunctional glutamate N-acetyltransferase/amino-acid acetyltransferase ArgJ [Chthoniobacteraceae bacterium]